MEWMLVKDTWTGKPIGSVGFIDDKIAVISAFYEDKDWNQDGKINIVERLNIFSMKGKAITEVASHAYAHPDILMRDPSLMNLRGKLVTEFAFGLIAEGVYIVYFNQAVGKLAGVAAAGLSANPIAQFMIKKGMEGAVKASYKNSVGV